jgi:hypothetical protein
VLTDLAADHDLPVSEADADTTRPHLARMYDYYLGGKDHFAADRAVADAALASWPAGRTGARENRRFLGRAVRYLAAEAGIRQFLDIGCGLPGTQNVHEIAQAADPTCRVVYVDNDAMVLAHARALLASAPQGRTACIQADLRSPLDILTSPATRSVIDFGQPVALMLFAVLHFLREQDKPEGILSALLDALPPGSYLAATHLTAEHDPEGVGGGQRAYQRAGLPMNPRDSGEFAALAFAGLELAAPGVVLVPEWRPETDALRPTPAEVSCYGGVARKR